MAGPSGDYIQIENYGQEPVRLTQVEVIGPKKK